MHWRAGTREAALLLGVSLLLPVAAQAPELLPTADSGDARLDAPSRDPTTSALLCGANALPSLRLSSAGTHRSASSLIVSGHRADHRVAIAHGDRIDLVDLAAPRLTASWTGPAPIMGLARLHDSMTLLAADADGRMWTISPNLERVAAHVAKTLPDPILTILELPSESALVVDKSGAWLVDAAGATEPTWLRLPSIDAALTAATVSDHALVAGDALGRVWRWHLTPRPLPAPRRIGQLDGAIVDLAACGGTHSRAIAADSVGTASVLWSTSSGATEPRRLATARPALTVAIDRSCTIAAASDGIAVSLWDLRAAAPEHASWSLPNLEPIRDIDISPDGLSLAIIAATTLRLWDLTDIARPPTTIHAPDDGPIAAYHGDSGRLLIATPLALAWIGPHSR